MVKKWPAGLPLLSVMPRKRQSTDVRLGLAAIADGLGAMVWIAAGHATAGLSVWGYTVDEQGHFHPVQRVSDAAPSGGHCKIGLADHVTDDGSRDGCEPERGGFGGTGGQFYGNDTGAP